MTEQVFNLNGLGLLFVEAMAHRDYTLIQALVLLVATVFIVDQFLVDLAYAWIDPRIRYRCMAVDPPIEVLADARPPSLPPVARRECGSSCRQRPLGALGAAVIVLTADGRRRRPLLSHRTTRWSTTTAAMLAAPSAAHWLGTDAFGRDVLSRIIYGSRTALLVGFGASVLGATLGAVLGRRQRLLRRVAGPDSPARHGRVPRLPADHPGPGGGGDPGHGRRPTSSSPSPSP